jgi:hypothetical protein
MDHHVPLEEEKHIAGVTPYLLMAREELASLTGRALAKFERDDFMFEVHFSGQSLWTIARWPDGGRLAARIAYVPIPGSSMGEVSQNETSMRLDVQSVLGTYHVQIDLPNSKQPLLHWRTTLAPAEKLTIPYWPPDLYPLDGAPDPLGTRGMVHVAQKGPRGAILYATVTRPWSGSFLYVQNLTALNDYFEKTRTIPADRIAEQWPELGFQLPPFTENPLPAGQETVISDAYLLLAPEAPADKLKAARLFLDLYAEVYLALPKPTPMHRDWPRRVDMTIRDLTHSQQCGIKKNGHRYLLAYVGADDRPPESMVQLAVLVPLVEYAHWHGDGIPIIKQLKANISDFYNPDVEALIRWLPGDEKLLAGKEEHMGEEIMDSWYLYHSFLNLSRLAELGDVKARRLFLKSVDYGIKVARHFSYHWPVFYNLHTLDVVKAETKPGAGGEHDVGAQYVHLMMQSWNLTRERRFIEEAERAAQAMMNMGFGLGYQFNNTSFGAGGLIRLWKETGNEMYLKLSYVCLANIVSNFWLWEADYGHAKNYHTFLGLPPLQDAPYLAMYEELEVLAAFHEYLSLADGDVPPSVRILLCEYCKFLIDRAWYHYPDQLPSDMIAEKPQSGHIDRELAIPLEDMYEGWQPAGQVGQEVYGAAAPFVFATRHCHRVDPAEFIIHCDYPVHEFTVRGRAGQSRKNAGSARFRIAGDRRCRSHVRLVPDDYTPLPEVTLKIRHGRGTREVQGTLTDTGYLEFEVPGDASVAVSWKTSSSKQ